MAYASETARPTIKRFSDEADILLDIGDVVSMFVSGARAFDVFVGNDRAIVVIDRDLYGRMSESEVERLVLARAVEMVQAGERAAWL